jgi:hypothetical protein
MPAARRCVAQHGGGLRCCAGPASCRRERARTREARVCTYKTRNLASMFHKVRLSGLVVRERHTAGCRSYRPRTPIVPAAFRHQALPHMTTHLTKSLFKSAPAQLRSHVPRRRALNRCAPSGPASDSQAQPAVSVQHNDGQQPCVTLSTVWCEPLRSGAFTRGCCCGIRQCTSRVHNRGRSPQGRR